MRLYAEVLDGYHLICYQLTSFKEIGAILDIIGQRDEHSF
jgi:hypothetical protein